MLREFDLNKPPTQPYRYQEYPRMLYRDGKTVVVKDDIETRQYAHERLEQKHLPRRRA